MNLHELWTGRKCSGVSMYYEAEDHSGTNIDFNALSKNNHDDATRQGFFDTSKDIEVGGVVQGFVCFKNENCEECWVLLQNIKSIKFLPNSNYGTDRVYTNRRLHRSNFNT